MKKKITFWLGGIMALIMVTGKVTGQKIDDDRMNRDIEVAENVLSTLIKQEINQQRTVFGLEIKGSYQPGYGVTFRLPGEYMTPMVFSISGADVNPVVWNDGQGFSYTYSRDEEGNEREDIHGDVNEAKQKEKEKSAYKLRETARAKRKVDMDSARDAYNLKVIKAAKDFIVDYGDFISQLGPNERIVVTNRGDQSRWGYFGGNEKRTHLSVEGLKSDLTAMKQGKLTRDQVMGKLKVVNTQTVNEKVPDMELLSSIFNRLYSADLSKTYFTESSVYYEFLKDFGVIYYMQVFSSNERDYKRYSMPTQDLDDVDKETRDKKVTELYPKFEKELKENILEYGRTLKSLKDEEVLVFNITLTKCKGCGIPENVELTIKASTLKDFGSGKIDQGSALSKFTIKKGPNQ
jgi:hypothetical protein